MKRAGSGLLGGIACRRRLTWPQLGSSQEPDDLKGPGEASPAGLSSPGAAGAGAAGADGDGAVAALGGGCAAAGITASTPLCVQQQGKPAVEGLDEALIKSPIIDGALAGAGRDRRGGGGGALVRRRLNGSPAAAAAAAGAAAEGSYEQQQQQLLTPAAPAASPPASPSPPPEEEAVLLEDSQEAAALQCQKVLAAAGSSSRGCLDLLCWGVALDQQRQAAEHQAAADSPAATPAAAGAGALPTPPRKRSARCLALPAGGACRAARLLPGLAPCDEAELQRVRAWMAVQVAN